MQSFGSPSERAGDAGNNPFYASSSQQQSALPNPDELQITAQLSRGLAPNMSAAHGGAMSESQVHRAQSQTGINHQYDHQQDPHAQGQHVQGRQDSVDQMEGQYGTPDGSMAPRKRSKVSRACDECRRKKIRCDATSESGEAACSSCKRVGTICQFSRVPMKRGPSKGYIKELADRLGQLEGAMQAGEMPVANYLHDTPQQRRGSEEFSPPPGQEHLPKKRTYSSVSGSEFGTPYLPHRSVSAWSTHESPRHLPAPVSGFASTPLPPVTSQVFRDSPYSPNGLAPLPQWKSPPEPHRRSIGAFETAIQDHDPSESALKMDDATMDRYETALLPTKGDLTLTVNSYYEIIHPTFPLLSNTKPRSISRWASYPARLRDGLHSALQAAVHSFPSSAPFPAKESSRTATELWAAAQGEGSASRSMATNLAYMQILLLLAIEAGNRVPGAARGQVAPSQLSWLGSAVTLAYELKLHQYKAQATDDPDSDERLGRRLWFCLVIMDRWHAASTSTPLLVADITVVMLPDDRSLLAESGYQLARLSILLGNYAAVATTVPIETTGWQVPPVTFLLGATLRTSLELWRDGLTVPIESISPTVLLCYWYLRIALELIQTESEPSSLMTPAAKIIGLLVHEPNLVAPLTYHSTILATLALIKLAEYDSTRAEAEGCLKVLMENRIAPSVWDSTVRGIVSHRKQASVATLKGSEHASTAAQGLQHLAELATANEEGRDISMGEGRSEGESFAAKSTGTHNPVHQDLRKIVKDGYLRVLGGHSGS